MVLTFKDVDGIITDRDRACLSDSVYGAGMTLELILWLTYDAPKVDHVICECSELTTA